MTEHFNQVTALEWNPKDPNLLLSVSADRATIVWKKQPDENYLPQMGIIPEKRANMCANWNMRGDKFIVGTSSGNLYVSTYNEM